MPNFTEIKETFCGWAYITTLSKIQPKNVRTVCWRAGKGMTPKLCQV